MREPIRMVMMFAVHQNVTSPRTTSPVVSCTALDLADQPPAADVLTRSMIV
ncbi:hypothetical protein OAF74_02225 [bacterium]|nr:hypothetical protein [bacterium]